MVLGCFLTNVLCNTLLYLIPMYQTYKILQKEEELKEMLYYWAVTAAFSFIVFYTDMFLSWFPFYNELKLFYVILSTQTQFTKFMYGSYLQPFLLSKETEIDRAVDRFKDNLKTKFQDTGYHIFDVSKQYILNFILKRNAVMPSDVSNIAFLSSALVAVSPFSLSLKHGKRTEKEKLDERFERERIKMEKDRERIEWDKIEKERIEKERIEMERIEMERIENERIERERNENDRIERERIENERIERERNENDRIEKERIENERIENERIEKERFEMERAKKESPRNERKEKKEEVSLPLSPKIGNTVNSRGVRRSTRIYEKTNTSTSSKTKSSTTVSMSSHTRGAKQAADKPKKGKEK